MSDITTKIESLGKVLDNQDKKISAISFRKEDHEARITNLENPVVA